VGDSADRRLFRDHFHMDGDIPVAAMDSLNQGNVIRPAVHHMLVMDGDKFTPVALEKDWQQALKGKEFALPFGPGRGYYFEGGSTEIMWLFGRHKGGS
jgi:hypothetical protein